MKSLRLLLPLTLIAALSACGGKGSTAPAPTNFQITAQDTQLHMTWTALPGVEYWVFCAPGASTIDSHSPSATHSGWFYYTKIFSGDYYATGLTNGTQYACTVNGRYDSGPGGADATPQVGTPRPAGATATWSSGVTPSSTALSGMTVRSVAYGELPLMSTTTDQFVAVGANGQIAVNTSVAADATMAWATPSQATSVSTNFNAVTFYPYTGGYRFVAAGAGGNVAYALNATPWAWTATTTGSSANVNALAASTGGVVAVGDSGYIATSSDGASWSPPQTSNTNNNLRAVAYAPLVNGTSSAYWVAVGDNGTIRTSTDGATWGVVTSGTSQHLNGVAVLPVTNSSTSITTYILTAVGNAGTLLVSTDNGATWLPPTTVSPTASANFVSVAAGRGVIMAVDASGNAYISTDGLSWSGAASGLSSAVVVMRYNPTPTPSYLATQSLPAISNGWMVFDASGNQRIAR